MASVPAEAEALLRDAKVMAHLATCREGRPHVAPVWYVYDDGVSASEASGVLANEESEGSSERSSDGGSPDERRESGGVVELTTGGRKLRNVRENPYVALSIQKDVDGDAQWMVSLLGTATVVEDDEQFRAANRRINEKYGADPDAYSENTLVRVDVGSASYRTY